MNRFKLMYPVYLKNENNIITVFIRIWTGMASDSLFHQNIHPTAIISAHNIDEPILNIFDNEENNITNLFNMTEKNDILDFYYQLVQYGKLDIRPTHELDILTTLLTNMEQSLMNWLFDKTNIELMNQVLYSYNFLNDKVIDTSNNKLYSMCFQSFLQVWMDQIWECQYYYQFHITHIHLLQISIPEDTITIVINTNGLNYSESEFIYMILDVTDLSCTCFHPDTNQPIIPDEEDQKQINLALFDLRQNKSFQQVCTFFMNNQLHKETDKMKFIFTLDRLYDTIINSEDPYKYISCYALLYTRQEILNQIEEDSIIKEQEYLQKLQIFLQKVTLPGYQKNVNDKKECEQLLSSFPQYTTYIPQQLLKQLTEIYESY